MTPPATDARPAPPPAASDAPLVDRDGAGALRAWARTAPDAAVAERLRRPDVAGLLGRQLLCDLVHFGPALGPETARAMIEVAARGGARGGDPGGVSLLALQYALLARRVPLAPATHAVLVPLLDGVITGLTRGVRGQSASEHFWDTWLLPLLDAGVVTGAEPAFRAGVRGILDALAERPSNSRMQDRLRLAARAPGLEADLRAEIMAVALRGLTAPPGAGQLPAREAGLLVCLARRWPEVTEGHVLASCSVESLAYQDVGPALADSDWVRRPAVRAALWALLPVMHPGSRQAVLQGVLRGVAPAPGAETNELVAEIPAAALESDLFLLALASSLGAERLAGLPSLLRAQWMRRSSREVRLALVAAMGRRAPGADGAPSPRPSRAPDRP